MFIMPPSDHKRKPIVAIVGAGFAGLTLAILLEKQGVQYEIFEQAKELKPAGGAMTVGANVVPFMKQLGLYEEFISLGKPWHGLQMYNNQREFQRVYPISPMAEIAGDHSFVFSRPALHHLLLRQISKDRLHMNQKVISFDQHRHGVHFKTSDNKNHTADILIAADGAHSAIRNGMYAQLKSAGKLPASDQLPLPYSTVCLLGQTRELDLETYPALKLKEAQFVGVEDMNAPYMPCTLTTAQNTMCWNVMYYPSKEDIKQSQDEKWGPEAVEAMCEEVRHLAIPGAAPGAIPLTLGDLIDQSPKELIQKVKLEEKVFKTWSSGRIVLIGDSCHKFNPAGGMGAMVAMHDAICLANWISVLPSTSLEEVTKIFYEYRKERYPPAKEVYRSSRMIARAGGHSLEAKALTFIASYTPVWVLKLGLVKMAANRPQVSFLPQVQDKGTVKPAYQPSLQKTLKRTAKAI